MTHSDPEIITSAGLSILEGEDVVEKYDLSGEDVYERASAVGMTFLRSWPRVTGYEIRLRVSKVDPHGD